MDRGRAAEVLRELADFGEFGSYPGLNAEEVGKAVARVACNSAEPKWLEGFLVGYGVHTREECDALFRVLNIALEARLRRLPE